MPKPTCPNVQPIFPSRQLPTIGSGTYEQRLRLRARTWWVQYATDSFDPGARSNIAAPVCTSDSRSKQARVRGVAKRYNLPTPDTSRPRRVRSVMKFQGARDAICAAMALARSSFICGSAKQPLSKAVSIQLESRISLSIPNANQVRCEARETFVAGCGGVLIFMEYVEREHMFPS